MKNTIKYSILFSLIFLSCNTQKRIDLVEYESYISKTTKVNYLKNYNHFEFNPLDSTAENQVFLVAYFEINIPKGLVKWMKSGNDYFFELENKQLIHLKIPNNNSSTNSSNWIIKDIDYYNTESISDYWINKMNKSENSFYKNPSNRLSKTYTNGFYSITLYNIEKNKFDSYLSTLKSFKVIPRNSP